MKLFFKFLGLVFHPWLILSYCVVLLWLVNPYVFQGASNNVELLMIKIWISSFLFPLLIAGVMIGLRFVDTKELNQSRERIFPLIGTMLFYIWLSVNMYKAGGTPDSLLVATIGATLALIFGFVFNLIFPISFHSLGMGVLIGNATLIYFYFGFLDFSLPGQPILIGTEWIVVICLWLAGWILTARIWIKGYSLLRVYGSLALGFVSQWLALAQLQLFL
ncbi:MAG: hypothetical protein GVX78_05830 [Bacteroidetes bacterium]|jgi:hypothetical protein|nr:hypothetical protein [Bacteroidota bacterium]